MVRRFRHPRATAVLPGLLGALLVGCGSSNEDDSAAAEGGVDRPHVAYVTNGVASFWDIAIVGAKQAGVDFECDVDCRTPGDPEKQKQEIEALLARGIDGIAVSMIDAENQAEVVDMACEQTHVITHDSDAPDTARLCYVGMDNYLAGRACGELVREAIPDGGEIMIFVGRGMQDNARKRRQGVIDAVIGRDQFQGFDDLDADLEGGGYKILGTLLDQFDRAKAKANAEDSLSAYPDLACMVGLFAYNPPLCLEALRGAGKLGEVEVVAFDEADETLQGILDGHVHGTVTQNPYEYGYQSVNILAKLAVGDRRILPSDGFFDIPHRVLRKDNVQEFWDDLKAKLKLAEESQDATGS